MKSYIKAIIIFNKNGEKRVVPLEQGVNIITGESKTGKSALVEIIDYCLCSTRCTIPKGKITDFSYLYTLVMAIDDNTYVIARYNWDDGSKMHFSKEAKGFEPENLELSYFVEKPALPYKDVKNEIECALGLFVTNMATDADQQGKKASLRNMVSYLFQHQNLMASKFALFYRFSDFYKRKDVIDQFPVFAGMISQEYYSDLIQLNTLKAQLKQKYKKQKANEKSTAYIKENLSPLLTDYFALLEQDFDGKISVQKMLKIASDLPEFDDTQLFGENKIAERYSELNAVLENLRNEEREILLKIKNIDNAFDTGSSFTQMLKDLKQQTSIAEIETDEYTCPLCGHECKEIAENDSKLIEATEWLDNELRIHHREGVDLLPSNIELSGFEVRLINAMSRERVLKTYVNEVKKNYDYVLIDCMPSLGMITINALAAVDSVIIPTQPHYLSAKGLELLLRSVSMVKRQINPKLRIDGILMTMVMPRTNISKEITATVKSAYGKKIKVFDTEIPHSIRAVEATAEGKSIFAYDKSGKVAAAYEQLGKEVAEIGEKQRNQNRADRIR